MSNLRVRLIYIVGAAIAAVQFAIIGAELGWLPVSTSQLTPALGLLLVVETLIAVIAWIESEAAAQAEAGAVVRRRLLQRVSQEWIKGVLQPALDETQIDLTLHMRAERPGMREGPLQKSGDPHYRLDATIGRHFGDMKRKLVIIGAAGSGKTMLLLQLMNALLQEAQARDSRPIPVLLQLASWGVEHRDFEAWLASELERNYGFGAQLALEWVSGQNLIYLLDGLDEVAPERRSDCVAAINSFTTRGRQIVIACRSEAFATVSQQLEIKKVIEIMPLSEQAARAALEREFVIEKVDAILAAARSSPEFAEQVKTPLMVNAIVEVFESDDFVLQPAEEATQATLRRMIIEQVMRKKLRAQSADYPPDAARRYLAWMAHNLRQRQERIFYVERLHGDWLPRRAVSTPGIRSRIAKLRFDLRWQFVASWRQLPRVALKLLPRYLFFYLPIIAIGLIVLSSGFLELFDTLTASAGDLADNTGQAMQIVRYFLRLLQSGAVAIVIGALILLTRMLKYTVDEISKGTEISPHSAVGIGLGATFKFSLLNVLAFIALSVFAIPIIYALQLADSVFDGEILSFSVNEGMATLILADSAISFSIWLLALAALLLIIIVWYISGGRPVLLHSTLRLILYRRKLTPRRIDDFVAAMVRGGIICRVGSGAFFIHREAQQYFADMWDSEYAQIYGTVKPVPIPAQSLGIRARIKRRLWNIFR